MGAILMGIYALLYALMGLFLSGFMLFGMFPGLIDMLPEWLADLLGSEDW